MYELCKDRKLENKLSRVGLVSFFLSVSSSGLRIRKLNWSTDGFRLLKDRYGEDICGRVGGYKSW